MQGGAGDEAGVPWAVGAVGAEWGLGIMALGEGVRLHDKKKVTESVMSASDVTA